MTDELKTTEVSTDDPRYAYAMVTSGLHDVIAGSLAHLDSPTPCTDFNVRELLNHIVMVQRRVAFVGEGKPWAEIQDENLESGWPEAFKEASQSVRLAWDDPARLEAIVSVPWGEFPGAAVLTMYVAELAAHGWDLAKATGQEFSVDDQFLEGAYGAAMFVPAEARQDPSVPFGEVVEVPDDAPLLDKIAAWFGRKMD